MNPQNFTNKSQEAIQAAARIADQNGQPQIEPPHLFLAFLEDEEGIISSLFRKLNVNVLNLKADTQALIDQLPKQFGASSGGLGQVMLSQAMLYIFQTAAGEAKKMSDEYISVEHLFLAFLLNKNPI
jgi:ATP-dependent Clp protease ATP-binding subunit ClpB